MPFPMLALAQPIQRPPQPRGGTPPETFHILDDLGSGGAPGNVIADDLGSGGPVNNEIKKDP